METGANSPLVRDCAGFQGCDAAQSLLVDAAAHVNATAEYWARTHGTCLPTHKYTV